MSADPQGSAAPRQGWPRATGLIPSHPLWDANLFGLRRKWLGVGCTLLLLAVVVASRAAVLPATIWDRDEAHLALAVTRFDPEVDRPHAPWFPLWVAGGKLAAPLASDPAKRLQILSGVMSVWTLFPLAALQSIWMRRRFAAATAVLYLFLPGPWFLSARAYSDTPATLLLLLVAAWWLRPHPDHRATLGGSIAAITCLLLRPQLILPVAGMGVLRWVRAGDRRDRMLVVLPLGLGAVASALGLVLATGSGSELLGSLARHVQYQLDGLPTANHGFASSGLARALILPELTVVWILLASGGIAVWHRRRSAAGGSPWPLVLAGLGPVLATVLLASDPTQTRYALPLLALSSGPAMIGLASMMGRWALAGVAVIVAICLTTGLPQAHVLRSEASPVISAFAAAGVEADARDGVVVVDRTLRVFADYATESRLLKSPVLTDFSVEIGAVDPPPAARTIAIFDRGRGVFVVDCDECETFRCKIPWMRRLGPDRFQDVTVAAGARVVRARTEW